VLSTTLDRVIEIQAESAERLTAAGAEGISATVALLGFESAPPKPKTASA
jgi:hypothetical protein